MEEILRIFVPSITNGILEGFILIIRALTSCAVSLLCHPETIATILIIAAYVLISSGMNKLNL